MRLDLVKSQVLTAELLAGARKEPGRSQEPGVKSSWLVSEGPSIVSSTIKFWKVLTGRQIISWLMLQLAWHLSLCSERKLLQLL